MPTHEKDGKVQFAVTLTWATTEAEKKSKDTSGAARWTRRDIPVQQRSEWWEGLDEIGTSHGAQNHHYEGLIEALIHVMRIIVSGVSLYANHQLLYSIALSLEVRRDRNRRFPGPSLVLKLSAQCAVPKIEQIQYQFCVSYIL
jgi:hypothetical protein